MSWYGSKFCFLLAKFIQTVWQHAECYKNLNFFHSSCCSSSMFTLILPWNKQMNNTTCVSFGSPIQRASMGWVKLMCGCTHKHTHALTGCISDHSQGVNTGVETVSISKTINRASVPLSQRTQTPPGDFFPADDSVWSLKISLYKTHYGAN